MPDRGGVWPGRYAAAVNPRVVLSLAGEMVGAALEAPLPASANRQHERRRRKPCTPYRRGVRRLAAFCTRGSLLEHSWVDPEFAGNVCQRDIGVRDEGEHLVHLTAKLAEIGP